MGQNKWRVHCFFDYLRSFYPLFFWKIPNLILYKTMEKRSVSTTLYPLCNMKSKDLQKLVLSKYDNGDGTTKIFRNLNGTISLSTIERWCRRICEVDTIDLVNPRGCSRPIRTKAAIPKVKRRLNPRKPLSSQKLTRQLGISPSSV